MSYSCKMFTSQKNIKIHVWESEEIVFQCAVRSEVSGLMYLGRNATSTCASLTLGISMHRLHKTPMNDSIENENCKWSKIKWRWEQGNCRMYDGYTVHTYGVIYTHTVWYTHIQCDIHTYGVILLKCEEQSLLRAQLQLISEEEHFWRTRNCIWNLWRGIFITSIKHLEVWESLMTVYSKYRIVWLDWTSVR